MAISQAGQYDEAAVKAKVEALIKDNKASSTGLLYCSSGTVVVVLNNR